MDHDCYVSQQYGQFPTYVQQAAYDAEVEYLQFTGTQYIDTLIQPTNHFTEVKYYVPIYVNDGHILGTSSGYLYYHFTEYNSGGQRYFWGRNGSEGSGGSWSSTIHVLEMNKGSNYSVVLDGTTLGSGYQIYSGNNLWIGRRDTTTNFQGYIYYCQITDKSTNQLVRDFIPVRVGNIGYLYDKVTGTLFGNQGTGSFQYGNDVSTTPSERRFLGWYTQQRTPDKTTTTAGSNVTSTSIVTYRPTIYALWQLPSDITFDATTNGGSMQPWSYNYFKTQQYGMLPTVDARQHYCYDGWFTSASGGTKITTESIVAGDTTLYAQWSAGVTVQFDATTNGGAMPQDWTQPDYFAGHAYGTLPVPTHSRLTFVGWYLNGELIDENSVVPAGGAVLVAQYAAMTYTIDISNGDWVLQSPNTNPDPAAYNGVYQSDRYHGSPPSSGCVVKMYINTIGYQTFDVFIRSNGENGWSYTIAVQPDIDPSDYNEAMSNALADTSGNATGTTSIDGYTKVTYNLGGGNHRICIAYIHKDNYTVGDDRGYVLIPKPPVEDEGDIWLEDLESYLYNEDLENAIGIEEEEQ